MGWRRRGAGDIGVAAAAIVACTVASGIVVLVRTDQTHPPHARTAVPDDAGLER